MAEGDLVQTRILIVRSAIYCLTVDISMVHEQQLPCHILYYAPRSLCLGLAGNHRMQVRGNMECPQLLLVLDCIFDECLCHTCCV